MCKFINFFRKICFYLSDKGPAVIDDGPPDEPCFPPAFIRLGGSESEQEGYDSGDKRGYGKRNRDALKDTIMVQRTGKDRVEGDGKNVPFDEVEKVGDGDPFVQ